MHYILINKIIKINFFINTKEAIRKVTLYILLLDLEWEMYVTTRGQNMAHLI